MVRARIHRWGNSLALRIPKAFAEQAGLQDTDLVDVSLVDGKLLVQRIARPAPSLDELLAAVTPENLYDEVSSGPAAGREAW